MDLVLVTKPVVLDELQGSHHLLEDDVVEGQQLTTPDIMLLPQFDFYLHKTKGMLTLPWF